MNAMNTPYQGGILIEGLRKVYGHGDTAVEALKHVNMQVAPGEVVGLVGPSGSGKSTLLKCLGAIIEPSSGRMTLGNEVIYDNGWKVKDLRALRRDRIGFVFQNFNLIDELTVEENVDLQLKYLGVGKAERKERVLEILRKVKLSHRAKHYPHQLSGGQQQRVAIARAVVGKPSIILADEPTGNLDSKNGMEVMQLLSELNEEGTTIVMVTHSKHDATYASRIINLFDGQVVDAMNDQL